MCSSGDPPTPDLTRLISPRSIAVVGASPDPSKFGNRALRFLAKYGFKGAVYPVTPGHQEIAGLTCFASVNALPEAPDLAIVAVPSGMVEDIISECAVAGVGAAVVYSSGFAETGPAGAAAQARLAEIAARSGMLLAGPNCQGLADFRTGAVSNFSTGLDIDRWKPGRIALVGQSGNVGGFIFKSLQAMGIGIAYLAATGNEAGVDACQVAEYFAGQPEVGAIFMYLDGIRSGGGFKAAAAAAQRSRVPLCVLKMGRFESGRKAALSHTAALSVDEEVFDAVCRKLGVLRLGGLQELIDVAFALGSGVPLPAGNGLAIASSSGGLAVMLADHAESLGLRVVDFQPETLAALDEILPKFMARGNPVDTATVTYNDVDRYPLLLQALLADPGVDQLQVALGLQMWQVEGAYRALREAAKTKKPVIVTWCGGDESVPGRLTADGIPTFDDPHRSLRLGRRLADLHARAAVSAADGESGLGVMAQPSLLWRAGWDEGQAEALRAHGIRTPHARQATSERAAVMAGAEIGLPVALKLIGGAGGHKSERNAVRLGLDTADAVARAFRDLEKIREDAADVVLVQGMVGAGIELLVGLKRDAAFGPVLVLSTGGFYVERWGDARAVVPPLTRAEVLAAIRDLTIAPLLDPHRGHEGADLESLVDAVIALAALFEEMPMEVTALEVNPLIVLRGSGGAWAVDWRCDVLPELTARSMP